MKKKPNLTLYRIGAIFFTCVLLIGIALVHYYYHYALLQSGMVLLLLVKFFFLPIFILSAVILNKRVNPGRFNGRSCCRFGEGGLFFRC